MGSFALQISFPRKSAQKGQTFQLKCDFFFILSAIQLKSCTVSTLIILREWCQTTKGINEYRLVQNSRSS